MKYIIEIEDEPFERNDDPVIPHGMDELYKAKGFNSLVFDENGLDKLTSLNEALDEAFWNGYKACMQENDFDSPCASCDAYQRGAEDGRNEAWETARKIKLTPDEGGLSLKKIHEIFGTGYSLQSVFKNFSASEAIAKLKAYEEQQKADEIKVGDWVFNKHVSRTSSAKVTCVDGQKVYILCDDGSCGFADITDLEKTNVSNPKIEQLLEMLKSEQRDCHTCKHPSSIECVDCRSFGRWQPKEVTE